MLKDHHSILKKCLIIILKEKIRNNLNQLLSNVILVRLKLLLVKLKIQDMILEIFGINICSLSRFITRMVEIFRRLIGI